MKRVTWLVALVLLLSAIQGSQSRAARSEDEINRRAVAGEFLVKLKPSSGVSQQAAAITALGGELVDQIPQLNVAVARFDHVRADDDQATRALTSALEQDPRVEYAEPNYIYTASDEPVTGSANTQIYLPLIVSGLMINDPGFANQYAWQTIKAVGAWGITQGSDKVVIAIVDSGVQLNHPDLSAKLLPGYDFVGDDIKNPAEDTDPSDRSGHGTHVAGIAAAITNNGIGGAGACPRCRLVPVRVLDNTGTGSASTVIKGIFYAIDHGAKVINLSLGGSDSSDALEAAINSAWNSGALVACAAGNAGSSKQEFPAAYPNCLAVASTTSSDVRASTSNYGAWVDLAAPGQSIYSTWNDGGYRLLSGTSMATPHVAGAAGLLFSQGLNNAQARARLESSADPISGTGVDWNNGRLNLFRAVRGN